jgi:DNA-cytosine methyltransferase
VTLSDTEADTVTSFAKNNDGRQYNKDVSLETAKKVSDAQYSDRDYESHALVSAVIDTVNAYKDSDRWSAARIANLYREHPEYNYLKRIHNGDKTALSELESLVSQIEDTELLDNLAYYPVYAYGTSSRKLIRKAINSYKKVINKRIQAVMEATVAGTDVGMEVRKYELAEIRDLFNSLNTNEDIAKLAEKVFRLAKWLDLDIHGLRTIEKSDVLGANLFEQVAFRVPYFNDKAKSNQEKASTILHELIHASTMYAISAVEKNRTLDESARRGVLMLENIYNQIKDDPLFKDEYGVKDVKEMVAELANPKFREKLQQKNLWQRIIDAIKSLLGIETKTGTALEGAEIALNYILDNYDGWAYEAYVEDYSKANRAAGRMMFSDRDSEGNTLSKEQMEFFKNSEVRWGNKLMPVYHGTREEFTVFDASQGYDDNRIGGLLWATKSYEYAKDYSFSENPIVMKGYLNITKMLDIGDIDTYPDYYKALQELASLVKLEPKELEAFTTYKNAYIYDITSSKGFKDRIVELGYDGVTAMESGIQTFGFVDSNQFKDTSNKAPTSDPDIRYSDRVLMGSLFSGGGTLEAGLVYQMLDKEFAVEYNKKIASVYTDNHGKDHMFVGDVRDFDSKSKQNVFYLHASPVCKNYSAASHSGGETTLDITTAQATARVLEEQMPQVFTVENVKRYIGSEAYNLIINKLNELGYTWDVAVYKASDYGNATKRERMIIRAVKDGQLPPKPQKASNITSWGEATKDLWKTDLIPSYLVKSKIEAIKNTPELKNLRLTKLDKPLMIYDTTKSKQINYAWADELAPTLTTKCGDARVIMPDGRVYAPTPKFMGRIQGLPDDYKYPKATTNAFKIIGNGIPTQLTKAVMGGVLDSAYEQTHDGQVLYSDRDPDADISYSLREEAPPKKTVEVYKLMRLKDGKIYPLFIDSTEPLEIGEWYDADSPNLDFLKKMPSGIFLVDTDNESYTTFADYLKQSGEKKTKFPSKKAIEEAASNGLRWVFIEDTAKGQKRFGGETRKYWNLGINGSGAVSTFSMRPGYHAGSLPTMRQIGKGANKDLRDDSFVWTVGEVPADIDYQAEADRNPDKDIPTHIPVNGYYLKATNADKAKSQADVMGWYVAGSYKINRVISDSEARQIIDDWNAEHPDAQALYDYDRESGMDFDADLMKLVPRETPQFSNREIQPITDAEYETLKKHFGVTANFRVAGYLLPDGKLLDFSGKHWGDTTSRSRQVDHRDVQEVLERGNNGISDMVDMIGSGCIRLMPETGGINLAVYPNEKQRRVLSIYIKQMLATEGQVIIDYDAVGGDTVHSRVYEKYASSSQILSDIRNYFNGAKQSDLMQFHTMYSERDTDAVSNRTLLANALESVAQNDIEKTKLTQYKEKIALIEAEQKALAETRAKIKALSFAKGARDTEAINKLQFKANQMANRINTYDKQLLNLESTKALKGVLEREKATLRKRLEQKGKEALNAQKAKNAETVREIMNRNTESRQKAVEGRHKTELKRDIKKLLQRILKVFKGGKERNVKESMKETVATALALGDVLFSNEISNLDIVNLGVESVTEKESKLLNEYRDILVLKESNLDKISTLRASLSAENKENVYAYISELEAQNRKYDRRITELNRLLSDVFARERARLNRMPVTTLINEFASEYLKLKSAEEDYIKAAYEPALYDRLVALSTDLNGVIARDMSLDQLTKVKKVFTMLEHTIQTANKEFRNGKWEDLQQSASAVMEEIEKLKDVKSQSSLALSKMKSYLWNELTPYYAFDKIGSNTLMGYFWDLIKGQSIAARDFDEANKFASATREKYGYSRWELDKVYDFQLFDGRTFSTTLKHLLSVYAYSKREQADLHMSIGGFFHNDKATFRKEKGILKMVRTDAVGYKVDDAVLAQIKAALGNEKMSYVDEMLGYLTKMGDKGNEVTRVLWGIDIFTEKVYFPLKSKDDFLKKSTETATAVSLKNDGMTKEITPGANNPIVLEAFDDVWADHVERMSTYHGLVIPIDNLNKVLHYGTWVGTDAMSVSTMLEGKFTSAVTDYLEQWINDLNGGAIAKGATNPFMSFFSKFKKTVVGASLSTVVQQPTAIVRAMAEIDAKYFVGKPNLTKLNEKWDEFKKYAPVATIKEIGGFDAGGGHSASRWINSDTLTGVDKVMHTVDDISMKGAEIADMVGWLTIWDAVKREIADTTNLKADSQEFLDKCGERATEVIVKTQVYDSTLSRSGFMRSKNDGVKMITSFMGEPTLSINMMYSAVINALRGGKEAKLKAAKTIGCVYVAIILAEALSSAIYALRDDDEDESYMEKYLQSLGGSVVSDIVLAPVTSLPGIKDIISIFQGWDVERSDMTIFKDIKDAFDGLDSESKSPYRKVEDFAGAIASAFGLPLKNILRTGREVYNAGSHILDDVSGGSAWGAFAEGITGKSSSNSDSLYKAMVRGDQTQITRIKGNYANEKAFESAVRQALRDNDSRIKEAAQARYDGDIAKYTRIAKAIIREGNFSQDTVVAAINAELNAIKRDDAEDVEAEDKDEVTSIYSGSDVNSAFDNGDLSLAQEIISELIETKVANGMEEKNAKSSLRSSMTAYWKPLYKEAYQSGDTNEMARIRQILYTSGLYGKANDVVKTTQGWLKD